MQAASRSAGAEAAGLEAARVLELAVHLAVAAVVSARQPHYEDVAARGALYEVSALAIHSLSMNNEQFTYHLTGGVSRHMKRRTTYGDAARVADLLAEHRARRQAVDFVERLLEIELETHAAADGVQTCAP